MRSEQSTKSNLSIHVFVAAPTPWPRPIASVPSVPRRLTAPSPPSRSPQASSRRSETTWQRERRWSRESRPLHPLPSYPRMDTVSLVSPLPQHSEAFDGIEGEPAGPPETLDAWKKLYSTYVDTALAYQVMVEIERGDSPRPRRSWSSSSRVARGVPRESLTPVIEPAPRPAVPQAAAGARAAQASRLRSALAGHPWPAIPPPPAGPGDPAREGFTMLLYHITVRANCPSSYPRPATRARDRFLSGGLARVEVTGLLGSGPCRRAQARSRPQRPDRLHGASPSPRAPPLPSRDLEVYRPLRPIAFTGSETCTTRTATV